MAEARRATDAKEIFYEADRQSDLGNHEKAFALLLQAEAQGYLYAQNSIGYFLDHGLGVTQDKEAAVHWYKKAARNNDVCGFANLGCCYRDKGNKKRAKFWFKRAFERGDGDAALELARLYAAKRKSHANRAKIIYYLKSALNSKSITSMSKETAANMMRAWDSQRN